MTTAFPPTDKPDAGYLLKLELENIRCFGDKQTLDLCAPGTADRPARWTIILGENGTGKTTLLQALTGSLPERRINDELDFPAVQLIVTAHSPLVVKSAPDANIVALKELGDHVEMFHHVSPERLDTLDAEVVP
jgi:predicted ATP-binding protein involved in virulence